MPLLRTLCTAACALLLLHAPAQAAETVQPPFGLEWEVCSRELDALLTKARANVLERKRTLDGEVWTVDSLPQSALRRAIFTLRQDALVEVELQYGADDWDIWMFDEFMHKVKGNLENRYGAGRQIARKREESAEVLQTLVGYNWRVSGRMLELIYFGAQDAQNSMRVVRLHYKFDAPELVKKMEVARH
jgi:hypothetical protein